MFNKKENNYTEKKISEEQEKTLSNIEENFNYLEEEKKDTLPWTNFKDETIDFTGIQETKVRGSPKNSNTNIGDIILDKKIEELNVNIPPKNKEEKLIHFSGIDSNHFTSSRKSNLQKKRKRTKDNEQDKCNKETTPQYNLNQLNVKKNAILKKNIKIEDIPTPPKIFRTEFFPGSVPKLKIIDFKVITKKKKNKRKSLGTNQQKLSEEILIKRKEHSLGYLDDFQ